MENKLIDLDVVESTQMYIKENTQSLGLYDACYTTRQTNGYGRTGNWDSSFENIYYSKLLPVEKHNHLSAICSMHMLIAKYAAEVEIKIPNDLYHDRLKMGGFIVENFDDYAILGIGININGCPEQFTSLSNITGQRYDIDDLIRELDDLVNLNLTMPFEMLETYYKQHCKIVGKSIKYRELSSDDIFTGTVNDLDSESITIDNLKFNQMQIKILNK